MDLNKILNSGKVPKEMAKTAILHEHNMTKCITKSELRKWKKVDLDLSEDAAKLVRQWSKALKVSEESIIYAATIQYVKETLGSNEVGY